MTELPKKGTLRKRFSSPLLFLCLNVTKTLYSGPLPNESATGDYFLGRDSQTFGVAKQNMCVTL